MRDMEMMLVTMDDQGRVTVPPSLRRRCGLNPGDPVLIIRSPAQGSALLHGVGLTLFSPVALGRRLCRVEEALSQIDDLGACVTEADPPAERAR